MSSARGRTAALTVAGVTGAVLAGFGVELYPVQVRASTAPRGVGASRKLPLRVPAVGSAAKRPSVEVAARMNKADRKVARPLLESNEFTVQLETLPEGAETLRTKATKTRPAGPRVRYAMEYRKRRSAPADIYRSTTPRARFTRTAGSNSAGGPVDKE